jgi:serpin B
VANPAGRRWLWGLLAILLGCAHGSPAPTGPEVVAARSLNRFAAQLHGVLRTSPGNLLYSPTSLVVALAMAREGARGGTAAALDRVLGADATAEARALVARLAAHGGDGPELALANRLFADGSLSLSPAFVETTRVAYRAPIEGLDFRHDVERGRARINSWVLDATHDKIKELIPRGGLNEWTRLVLVNAVYLKAGWLTPFSKEATRPAPFLVAGGTRKDVPTMHAEFGGAIGHHAGARVLALPYRSAPDGLQLSMLVVVPERHDGLADLEKAYMRDGVEPFARALTDHGIIEVSMPTFKVAAEFQLSTALQALGLGIAFTDDADFSGISERMPTKISEVFHKAWANVDENGTEAAAATAVVMVEVSSLRTVEPKRYVFKVDRSFLFFVRDDASGAVLFAGRVLDPASP